MMMSMKELQHTGSELCCVSTWAKSTLIGDLAALGSARRQHATGSVLAQSDQLHGCCTAQAVLPPAAAVDLQLHCIDWSLSPVTGAFTGAPTHLLLLLLLPLLPEATLLPDASVNACSFYCSAAAAAPLFCIGSCCSYQNSCHSSKLQLTPSTRVCAMSCSRPLILLLRCQGWCCLLHSRIHQYVVRSA
jgi:hypothetical protein